MMDTVHLTPLSRRWQVSRLDHDFEEGGSQRRVPVSDLQVSVPFCAYLISGCPGG